MRNASATYTLWHRLHALEHRAFLLFEAQRLRRAGVELPPTLLKDIWRRPNEVEDFIHISAFMRNKRGRKYRLVDVGANVGNFIDDFRIYFGDAEIVAFEPDPRNFTILEQKYKSSSNIKLYNYALSNEGGFAPLLLSDNTKYSSFEQYNKLANRNHTELNHVNVPRARFNQLNIDLNDMTNILKVDVQGHEINALMGFGRELDKFSMCLIETSFAHEYIGQSPSFPDVVAVMKENNLFPIVFQRFGRTNNSYGIERDVLFVREDLLKYAYWDK